MRIEIIGEKVITTNGVVTVKYIDGELIIYHGKKTSSIVLNPSQIKYVSVE